jgi:membrane-bound lytic murein transglycosylase D
VRPGDSAGAIAMAHRVSLQDLIRANNLNSKAMIRVGQNLRIPTSALGNSSVRVASGTAPVPELKEIKKLHPTGQVQPVVQQDVTVAGNLKVANLQMKNNLLTGTIEVQPDESIRLLADWLKVTPDSIRINNNLSKNGDIHPGQEITLDFINTKISTFEENRFDFHQELQEDFFSSYQVVGFTSYRVKNGDTIWELCRKRFDVPLWLLKKYNEKLNYAHLELASNIQVPILKEI